MSNEKFKVGDWLVALYTFKGNKSEDLSFKKGDKLTVCKLISDENWLMCTNSSEVKGLVPVNHIKVIKQLPPDQPWFYGPISRKEAESHLQNAKDGDFLVRTSDRFPGDYTVCVKFDEKVEFYHVIKKSTTSASEKYTLDEESYFSSVDELIKHYQKDADGLCCKLNELDLKTLNELDSSGFTIPAEKLTFGTKIGCGDFNEVLQGTYENKDVAIKCFKKNLFINGLFNYESTLMAKLNHENLVKFIGVSQKDNFVYIITEFMENGSLVNYLRSRGRSVIQPQDQINFAINACKGMTYLEDHCLVHRDLAARNILLNKDLVAKVCDFGLAKETDDRPRSSSSPSQIQSSGSQVNGNKKRRAPPPPNINSAFEDEEKTKQPNEEPSSDQLGLKIPVKWTAPEALAKHIYTNKSDVWSFGILLWEIYSFGRTPYPRIYANDVRSYLERGYRMDAPEDTPKEMYELMRICWAGNPEQRPNFREVLKKLEENKKIILSKSSPKIVHSSVL